MEVEEKQTIKNNMNNNILFSYFPTLFVKDIEGYRLMAFLLLSAYYVLWLISFKVNIPYFHFTTIAESVFTYTLINIIFPEKFISNNKIFFSIFSVSIINFLIIANYIPQNKDISVAIFTGLILVKGMNMAMRKQEMKYKSIKL